MDTKLQVLRAKIKGLQGEGEALRRRIQKSSGLKRHSLWQQKRALGVYSRYHLVAYGLLRGVPYEKIERCDKNNQLDPTKIFELMKAHVQWQQERVLGKLVDTLTLEKVKASLEITPAKVIVESAPAPAPPTKSLLDRARTLLVGVGVR